MISISKNVYIDKLGDKVKKYNNTYHINIKMKYVNIKSKTHINLNKENNYKDPKFKVGDYVRISKCKNIFPKVYVPDWSKEVFVIKKVKNAVYWTCLTEYLNEEQIIGTFYKNELQKTNQKKKKIIKMDRKSNLEKR